MSAYTPLPAGSDALWLHSFAGAPTSHHHVVHAEHCACRCAQQQQQHQQQLQRQTMTRLSREGTSGGSSTGSSSSTTTTTRRATLKRVFQSSLALLFLCSAFLIYLHSPPSSTSGEGERATPPRSRSLLTRMRRSSGDDFVGGVDNAVVAAAPRSGRLIRALTSAENVESQRREERENSAKNEIIKAGDASLLEGLKIDSSPSSSSPSQPREKNINKNDDDKINIDNLATSSFSQGGEAASSSTSIPQTELKDILFTVKTTAKFHATRLPILLDTWVSFVRDNTYFFTDADDARLARRLPPHRLVNTNCSASHNRKALCCKMAAEFDAFLRDVSKRWFCHVDDDTYVNVPEMLHLLRTFDHREDWYLGKPSLRHPIEIIDRDHMNHVSAAESERVVQMRASNGGANSNNVNNRATFWFATGGAGFCISRSLADKMAPVAGEGRFKIVGDNIRMTDDITMGYIVEHVLKKKLTVVDRFHSHLESMRLIPPSQIESQVTLSYGSYGNEMNILRLKGFPEADDPSRLRSLHCRLFPGSSSTTTSTGDSTGNLFNCPDRTAFKR